MRPFAQATRRASHVGAPCACGLQSISQVGVRLGKKTVADMFRTAAAINDTAVLARAYMGYVESVRRVEPRLLAEIDIFACRGRVGGVDVVFKSVDGRCKVSSVGAAVEKLVDRSFGR